jgi:plastocyanin
VRRVTAGVALACVGALAAAPALADQTVTAGPVPNTFATTNVTIDQGQTLTFQNSDRSAMHDVTSDKNGNDSKPVFASETIDGGKTAPVKGVEFLTTGDYGFHCSLHPFMTGTVHVTANGTPKPRTPDNPAPNSTDTTPPTASATILDSSIAKVLKRGTLLVRLTTDEPSRFKVTVKSGTTTIATGAAVLKGTKRNAAISLTKAGKKLLKQAKTATIKLTAQVNDAANNKSAASASRKLTR